MGKFNEKTIKNTLKFIFKAFFCIFCIIFLVFMPQKVFSQQSYLLDINQYFSSNEKSKVVITLHHIETFEGGSKSRSKYLEKECMLFNKKYNNVYISVVTLTPEQLVLNLKENIVADLYSFGTGVGEYLSGYLGELDWSNSLPPDSKIDCILDNKILCLPYIKSGYFLISNQNLLKFNKNIDNYEKYDENCRLQSVVVNKKELKGVSLGAGYTSSISSIANLSADIDDYVLLDSSYKAYCNFVEGSSVSLLGTTRDMHRCKNREENGSLSACVYTPLSSYSDLIQYIGFVEKDNNILTQTCRLFIEHLLSSSAQSHLASFGLFSPCLEKIYFEGDMSYYENEFSKTTSINAFTSLDDIINNRTKLINKVFA